MEQENPQDAIATMNTWAEEGFRLHAGSSHVFMVMEEDPAAVRETSYQLIGPAPVHQLLDAVSDAVEGGSRIVRFMGSGAVLLER